MLVNRDTSPPQYNNNNNNSYHQHKSSQQRQHIKALKSRLSPIRDIEQRLIGQLVPPDEEEATHLGNGNLGGNGIHYTTSAPVVVGPPGRNNMGQGEVFVRPTSMWRGALARARVTYPSFFGDDGNASSDSSAESAGSSGVGGRSRDGSDDIQEILNALCGDMIQLWEDPNVREVLRRHKIRLEEGSGFFLNDLKRVTSPKYVPSDGE
jgi:guanine nucleotide-binding protein subunit alpha